MREEERWEWVVKMLKRDFGDNSVWFTFYPFDSNATIIGAVIRFFVPPTPEGIDIPWLRLHYKLGVNPDFDMYRQLSGIFNGYKEIK